MEASTTLLATPNEATGEPQQHASSPRNILDRLEYTIYALALALSICVWFVAIRAPLWLDETISFFLVKGGFAEIMSRQGWPDVPVYSYVLWLWTKVMGTGEITLRVSSVLIMLGAVYLLYRAARELFDRDVALIAAVVFCLHPIVIYAAIDVRPYALGAVAINSSILALVRMRHSNSKWLAAFFGVSAASVAYFQFLFVVILPALAICFFLAKGRPPEDSMGTDRRRPDRIYLSVPAGYPWLEIFVPHQWHPRLGPGSEAPGSRHDPIAEMAGLHPHRYRSNCRADAAARPAQPI